MSEKKAVPRTAKSVRSRQVPDCDVVYCRFAC